MASSPRGHKFTGFHLLLDIIFLPLIDLVLFTHAPCSLRLIGRSPVTNMLLSAAGSFLLFALPAPTRVKAFLPYCDL